MALTFRELGNQGGLGNQLFQIAATIGAANRQGYDYAFPEKQGRWTYRECFLSKLPIRTKPEEIVNNIWENHFHFAEITCPDNTNLSGFFQSEKYWKHCEDLIRKSFEFNTDIISKMDEKYGSFIGGDTCAIHVRRGDYVNNNNHNVLFFSYYHQAMRQFKGKTFLVFSDDINWCKYHFREANLVFVEGNSDIEDLCLMAMCRDFIIANSSFSWWGAYLSKWPHKKVIAPRQWFGQGLRRTHDTKDLYCEGWKLL